MEGVGLCVENCVPFTSSLHSVACIYITFHLPGEFPLGYRIKFSLQKGGIAFGFDAAVEDAIISKETDCVTILIVILHSAESPPAEWTGRLRRCH